MSEFVAWMNAYGPISWAFGGAFLLLAIVVIAGVIIEIRHRMIMNKLRRARLGW